MKKIVLSSHAFDPVKRGKNLCVDFNSVVQTFAVDPAKRVAGLLSAYLYDGPCFEGDRVNGGSLYRCFITADPDYYLHTSETPLLQTFAPAIGEYVGTNATIYDLGPGPRESVHKKTMVILKHAAPYHVYKPCDITPGFLKEAENAAHEVYPDLPIKGEVINFQNPGFRKQKMISL